MAGEFNPDLMKQRKIEFVSLKQNGCAYFQQGILRSVLPGLALNRNKHQGEELLWAAIQKIRYRWLIAASGLSAVGLGGAGSTTWGTRVHCRPVMVNVSPYSRACGFIRLCPFCYARKCWSEYSHLRNIMFVKGEPHSWRRVTAMVRRFHFDVDDVVAMESLMRQQLEGVRVVRAAHRTERKLKKLKGWFRSHKMWVRNLPGSGLRLHMETMLLGTTRGEDIPASLFLLADAVKPKNVNSALVYERTWYDRALTRADFRRWMLRTMRYRPEWLSDDIETLLAYNRVLHDMRFQQFYRGGEFRQVDRRRADTDNQDE